MATWNEKIPESEIRDKITAKTVDFAERFGKHLAQDDTVPNPKNPNRDQTIREKMTTNQLRKFFGEVKRQQQKGYNPTDFILLKPKLAYAVGRAQGKNPKIKDFYIVLSSAIDMVSDEMSFRNFIKFFESIVAYHKAYEN